MEGMNSFLPGILVKLNCYYNPKTSSFTSPVIEFEFINPINEKVQEELKKEMQRWKTI